MKSSSKHGFSSVTVLMLLGFLSSSLMVAYFYIAGTIQDDFSVASKIYAHTQSELSIEDAYSFFKMEKGLFYNPSNISPCITIGSIASYSNYSLDEFVIDNTLKTSGSDIDIGDENLKDYKGFLNRECTLYSQGLPLKSSADFSVRGDGNSISSKYRGRGDENGFYNIKKIYDNAGIGIFFTRGQIGRDNISVNLDYNFSEFAGVDNINIFSDDISDKILLAKKNDPNLDISKTNLKSILQNTMEIFDDARIEIGMISFDGVFSPEDGFEIDINSGEVVSSEQFLNTNSQGNTKGRLICGGNESNCSLRGIDLLEDKIYFLYIKTFDKPTTYHLDFLDFTNSPISLPSTNLRVSTFGYADGELFKKERVIDIANETGYYAGFSSQIYNYVFFSRN